MVLGVSSSLLKIRKTTAKAKADPSLRLKNGYGQDDTSLFVRLLRTEGGR
jgi:hypothetical protein